MMCNAMGASEWKLGDERDAYPVWPQDTEPDLPDDSRPIHGPLSAHNVAKPGHHLLRYIPPDVILVF